MAPAITHLKNQQMLFVKANMVVRELLFMKSLKVVTCLRVNYQPGKLVGYQVVKSSLRWGVMLIEEKEVVKFAE